MMLRNAPRQGLELDICANHEIFVAQQKQSATPDNILLKGQP